MKAQPRNTFCKLLRRRVSKVWWLTHYIAGAYFGINLLCINMFLQIEIQLEVLNFKPVYETQVNMVRLWRIYFVKGFCILWVCYLRFAYLSFIAEYSRVLKLFCFNGIIFPNAVPRMLYVLRWFLDVSTWFTVFFRCFGGCFSLFRDTSSIHI